MFSPSDLFIDHNDRSAETLWSISSKVGLEKGYDPEEICTILEEAFPNYTLEFHNYSYNKKNREYYCDDIAPEAG